MHDGLQLLQRDAELQPVVYEPRGDVLEADGPGQGRLWEGAAGAHREAGVEGRLQWEEPGVGVRECTAEPFSGAGPNYPPPPALSRRCLGPKSRRPPGGGGGVWCTARAPCELLGAPHRCTISRSTLPQKPIQQHKTPIAGGFLMVASNSWRLLGNCCYCLQRSDGWCYFPSSKGAKNR